MRALHSSGAFQLVDFGHPYLAARVWIRAGLGDLEVIRYFLEVGTPKRNYLMELSIAFAAMTAPGLRCIVCDT